ncbi:MAG: hypothetical protein AB4038_18780 [Prochloraceae cyanobacterium]
MLDSFSLQPRELPRRVPEGLAGRQRRSFADLFEIAQSRMMVSFRHL